MKNDSARDKAMDKLVEARLRSGLNPGSPSCLDAEILAAYVERTLTSRERAQCELHLASCANCQEHVAALVRLSEADEPASLQNKTAAPARAAGISWFRWAWAGPALAAILVMGIYFGGPFRTKIQQIPGPEDKIQNPVAPKPATPSLKYDDRKSITALPPASTSRRQETNQPAERRVLDEERATNTAEKPKDSQPEPTVMNGVGGIAGHKERTAKTQNEVTGQPPPAPAPAPPPREAPVNGRIEPTRQGAIAPPSVRADLAKKDERGQGAGTAGTTISGVAAGIASPTAPAKPSTNQSEDALQNGGRNAPAISPQPVAQTGNQKTRSAKSALYDESKAKKEAQTNDAESTNLHENERDKQEVPSSVNQSVSVGATSESVEVSSGIATPAWRVGRRGLIQKLDAKGKWRKEKSGVKADLYAIAFSSPEVGWAVGQSGTVLRTTDGGASWRQLANPTTGDLVRVISTSGQAASVVTRSGLTFITIDGGATWSVATH